ADDENKSHRMSWPISPSPDCLIVGPRSSCGGVMRWRRTMTGRLLKVLAICAVAAAAPARADVRILGSAGGEGGGFISLFERLRDSGARLIIDGPCYSACTLVLSAVPPERICVTRRAVLGFHGARLIDRAGNVFRSARVDDLVTETYPEPVQRW